jgi:hypothetical protein
MIFLLYTCMATNLINNFQNDDIRTRDDSLMFLSKDVGHGPTGGEPFCYISSVGHPQFEQEILLI